LNAHGIHVRRARNTALAELCADLPPRVLADLVDIGLSTATRWAHNPRRDLTVFLAAHMAQTRRRRVANRFRAGRTSMVPACTVNAAVAPTAKASKPSAGSASATARKNTAGPAGR